MRSRSVCVTLAAFALGLSLSASARDVVLPAGTLLQCTLNEPNFSSATAAVGDPVLCHLRGITQFGQQAFPRGSYLVGHLESDKNPGHFFGKGNLKLQFDRIGLPSGDMPLDAKIIATRGYKVGREGDIKGKGHAKRDIVEWMLPPLWPWKVMMLPARGPRPALKGESVMTLRLMDDIELPHVAQRQSLPPGGTTSTSPEMMGSVGPWCLKRSRSLCAKLRLRRSPQITFASLKADTDSAYVPAPAFRPVEPVAGLFVADSSGVRAEDGHHPRGEQLHLPGRTPSYSLTSGGNGVISTDEVDWNTTLRVNQQRGVRVTLRAGRTVQGASGF